jgi:hypothetical protein
MFVRKNGTESMAIIFFRSLPIGELAPRLRQIHELLHYACHALMVACDGHLVLSLAELACIW